MEQTRRSETSAYKIQTPGIHPEESTQHSEHGESLKSRTLVSSAQGHTNEPKIYDPKGWHDTQILSPHKTRTRWRPGLRPTRQFRDTSLEHRHHFPYAWSSTFLNSTATPISDSPTATTRHETDFFFPFFRRQFPVRFLVASTVSSCPLNRFQHSCMQIRATQIQRTKTGSGI